VGVLVVTSGHSVSLVISVLIQQQTSVSYECYSEDTIFRAAIVPK